MCDLNCHGRIRDVSAMKCILNLEKGSNWRAKAKRERTWQYLSKHGLWLEEKTIDYTTQTIPLTQITINNGPFVAERSNGTKSPNWRGNDTLGHAKIQIWWLCVTCLSVSFALSVWWFFCTMWSLSCKWPIGSWWACLCRIMYTWGI